MNFYLVRQKEIVMVGRPAERSLAKSHLGTLHTIATNLCLRILCSFTPTFLYSSSACFHAEQMGYRMFVYNILILFSSIVADTEKEIYIIIILQCHSKSNFFLSFQSTLNFLVMRNRPIVNLLHQTVKNGKKLF